MRLVVRDSDLAKVGPALKRAAAQAKRLAIQSGTPFYVLKGGRVVVVDLNKRSAAAYTVRERKSRYGR